MGERKILCVVPRHDDAPVCDHRREAGWDVAIAADLKSAHRLLHQHRFLVGLLITHEFSDTALEDLHTFLQTHNGLEWVGVFDLHALARPACRELILDHFFDHHTQPVALTHLSQTLGHAYGHAALRQADDTTSGGNLDGPIVGQSAPIKNLLWQIKRIAKVDAPVLVRGESGSGKELAAQAIHQQSSRANGPFVPVNCGAIHPSLIQSELFGHTKGSFTGASRDEQGLIEAASGGTVFLDEIGTVSPDLQINLLRFLQEMTISRIGSTRNIRVDVRVIAATNADLEKAVMAGEFREDLFYRLNVLPLQVPPLRERKSDVALLAQHCFKKFAHDKSPRLRGFSRRALLAMETHEWPGNVRELVNRVRRAMVMGEGRLITPMDLGLEEHLDAPTHDALDEARTEAERLAVYMSLQSAGSNVTRAARQLGVSRMTLYRLMAKHRISN
ncbi:MAG: sigma-54 dependent transcriptional regulator [Rhizobacter sp.]